MTPSLEKIHISRLHTTHEHLVHNVSELRWMLPLIYRFVGTPQEWTIEHSIRVADISVFLGDCLGLSDANLRKLTAAGLTHDIGKLDTPPEILNKDGPLTVDEETVMYQHPRFAYSRLKEFAINAPLLSDQRDFIVSVAEIVVAHHEFKKQKQYPRKNEDTQAHDKNLRLGGNKDKILLQQILAVADYVESRTEMGNLRPYMKNKLSWEEACDAAAEELDVPIALIELMRLYKISNGHVLPKIQKIMEMM